MASVSLWDNTRGTGIHLSQHPSGSTDYNRLPCSVSVMHFDVMSGQPQTTGAVNMEPWNVRGFFRGGTVL